MAGTPRSSNARERLILKGGLYLYGNFGLASRPTRDIDFLGRPTPADVAQIVQMAHEIARIDLHDGVHFDLDSIRGEQNRAATEHGGVRIEMTGYLGSARERLQIDVGFGDALPTGPFAPAFTSDPGRQAQWSAFLRRIRQVHLDSFPSLMEDIRNFIEPILSGAAQGSWDPVDRAWREG